MVRTLAALVTILAAATPIAGQSRPAQPPAIPLLSEALARERGPTEAPFIVTYRSRGKILAFVGADHVFSRANRTTEAIRRAFADTHPSMVILEGFPTSMGRNFEPIVAAVHRREQPDADAFARSEAIFAASLALASNVPFLGGEPTVIEELEGLVAGGYDREDVLFAIRLRSLGQARRSGEMPVGDAATFAARLERESLAVGQMTGTKPATQAQFVADYLRIIGVDPVSDVEMPHRYDPGTETLLRRMGADNMRVRDAHLLSTILRQLDGNDRVLVVYGSSHWTTLSRALQEQLGKPEIASKETINHATDVSR